MERPVTSDHAGEQGRAETGTWESEARGPEFFCESSLHFIEPTNTTLKLPRD